MKTGMMLLYVPCVFGVVGIILAWSQEETIKKQIFILYSGMAILIIGLRGNIDVDYNGYFNEYNDQMSVLDFQIAKGELLYNFLASLFKSIGVHYAIFVLFTTTLSIWIKGYIIIRHCKSPLTALSVYFCIAFIETEIITVKWAVATSFLMLSVHYLYANRRAAALIAYLSALGFHSFSLVYLLAAPMLFMDRTIFYVVVLSVALIFGAYFPMENISDVVSLFDVDTYALQKIQSYTSQDMNAIGTFSILKVLFLLSFWVVALVGRRRVNWASHESTRYILRPALLFLAFSLILYNYKVFYYRAAVIVDFYLIILAINSVHSTVKPVQRAVAYSILISMFILWSLFDVHNHHIAGYIKDYEFAPIF